MPGISCGIKGIYVPWILMEVDWKLCFKYSKNHVYLTLEYMICSIYVFFMYVYIGYSNKIENLNNDSRNWNKYESYFSNYE